MSMTRWSLTTRSIRMRCARSVEWAAQPTAGQRTASTWPDRSFRPAEPMPDWIWQPSREWIESTNVWRFMQSLGFDDRETFLAWSRDHNEEFWDRLVRAMKVEW